MSRYAATKESAPKSAERKPKSAATAHDEQAPIAGEDTNKLLPVAEVAVLLGVHPRTVRHLIKAGALAAYRIDRQLRVDPEGVARLLEASRIGGSARTVSYQRDAASLAIRTSSDARAAPSRGKLLTSGKTAVENAPRRCQTQAPTSAEHTLEKAEAARRDKARVPQIRTHISRSFVVTVEKEPTEGSPEFTAHIKPVEAPAEALVSRSPRLSDAVLDVISDLLVEIVREDEEP